MTGWDEHGHARPTGLPVDRYLGDGDLQDAENCGYAPTAVLAEMGVDRTFGDPLDQYREGIITLVDGTILERGGTLNCVWAVTATSALDHSGVAGEPEATTKEASESAQNSGPTPTPAPTPETPGAVNVAGGEWAPVTWAEAVAVSRQALLDAEAKRTALAERDGLDGIEERDHVAGGVAVPDEAVRAFNAAWWDASNVGGQDETRIGLTAAAPLIAAQALRSAAEALRIQIGTQWGIGDAVIHLLRRADELERGGDR